MIMRERRWSEEKDICHLSSSSEFVGGHVSRETRMYWYVRVSLEEARGCSSTTHTKYLIHHKRCDQALMSIYNNDYRYEKKHW